MTPGYLLAPPNLKDRCPECLAELSPPFFDARYTASYIRQCLNEFCRFTRIERKV